jgi:hypothetical protein
MKNYQVGAFAENFEPYRQPPDFAISKKHALANRVLDLGARMEKDINEEQFCPCCHLPSDAEPYSLWTNIWNLGDLGSGFVLFFDLVRFLILFMVI